MRRSVVALTAAGAAVLTGCSAPHPPEVTFYADGDSVQALPLSYCDALLTACDTDGEPVTLDARPGQPVQISVPAEIAETPWLVIVQSAAPDGTLLPMQQEVFTDGTRHAHTVVPETPEHQPLVVEVQQLGAAYAVDENDQPIMDEQGSPQLVVRGVWSLQIDPD
ncbi:MULTISPECIES: DUF2771 family protein [Saccharomonospora]|jgi:hypothetical protein|uniref:DUF2771 family protein n=1 Tax=Saccharomonospora glauca K62 TaxID=928724 RepID=I1D6P2_9PSEU|nr:MULTISPECIES: DUF2771 family protein [Saccharomonospora]EIF00617.1 Protein of unknown function (DUF2771) [Saccharomonospora glauca K62]